MAACSGVGGRPLSVCPGQLQPQGLAYRWTLEGEGESPVGISRHGLWNYFLLLGLGLRASDSGVLGRHWLCSPGPGTSELRPREERAPCPVIGMRLRMRGGALLRGAGC